MYEPLFAVANTHTKGSAVAEVITNQGHPDQYLGYFEDVDGNQYVFRYDKFVEKGYLRTGLTDWGTEYQVIAAPGPDVHVPGFPVLTLPFRDWLKSCWRAATEAALKKASP